METCTGTKDRITDNCDKLAFNDLIEKKITVGVDNLFNFKSEHFINGTLKKVCNGYLNIFGCYGGVDKKKKPHTILIPEKRIIFVEECVE